MVTIAVDAMGADSAPRPELEGALAAVRAYDVRVALVGPEQVLRAELRRMCGTEEPRGILLRHASERITMDDSAAKAVRNKRDSSLRVAARLVREGEAHGFVSAGNTGAAMATAKIVQGVVPGIERPALASAFPTIRGTPAVVIDVGANVDASPRMLAQFAVMGDVYSRVIFHTERPRVGLLSIGEEEHKGNELTHAATPLLKALDINFVGNVEGRDLYSGAVDVIVCDGFVGNVALKTSEGVVEVVRQLLRQSLGENLSRRVGYILAKGAFDDFRRRLDYSEYGGAPLLGVRGVCVICHGRSNANAIKNAIRVASEFVKGRINERIEGGLGGPVPTPA